MAVVNTLYDFMAINGSMRFLVHDHDLLGIFHETSPEAAKAEIESAFERTKSGLVDSPGFHVPNSFKRWTTQLKDSAQQGFKSALQWKTRNATQSPDKEVIETLQRMDILVSCRRPTRNKGYALFRSLMSWVAPMYVGAPTKIAKRSICVALHQYLLCEAGVRFLVRDNETGLFVVAPFRVARQKIGHAFRDKMSRDIPRHIERDGVVVRRKDLNEIVNRVLATNREIHFEMWQPSQKLSYGVDTRVPLTTAAFERAVSKVDGRSKVDDNALEGSEIAPIKQRTQSEILIPFDKAHKGNEVFFSLIHFSWRMHTEAHSRQ